MQLASCHIESFEKEATDDRRAGFRRGSWVLSCMRTVDRSVRGGPDLVSAGHSLAAQGQAKDAASSRERQCLYPRFAHDTFIALQLGCTICQFSDSTGREDIFWNANSGLNISSGCLVPHTMSDRDMQGVESANVTLRSMEWTYQTSIGS